MQHQILRSNYDCMKNIKIIYWSIESLILWRLQGKISFLSTQPASVDLELLGRNWSISHNVATKVPCTQIKL
jgi:hypothetical protein